MRLLRAELRKLRRPLVAWTGVAMIAVTGLLAWVGVATAADSHRAGQQVRVQPAQAAPSCRELGVGGQECRRRQEELRRRLRESIQQQAVAARSARVLQHPVGSGRVAAGMVASLPGTVALLLLAAGHVGNEWSGRTIRSLLIHEGRRWRVLAAKLVSLWLLGAGFLLVTWLALAPLALALRAYDLGGPPPGTAAAWSQAWPAAVRSLLVVAVTAALGTLAGVVTRNTLGAFFLGFAVVVTSLLAANLGQFARLSLAYAVAGWMRFQAQSPLPDHVWNDVAPARVSAPGPQAGLYGLLAYLVLAVVLALLRMSRSDVTV